MTASAVPHAPAPKIVVVTPGDIANSKYPPAPSKRKWEALGLAFCARLAAAKTLELAGHLMLSFALTIF
jgi:hypothetical protein